MISFALDEEQQIVQETVRSFAAEVVRPALRTWEKARGVPDEARRRFHELGLGLIDVPEDLGGGGAGALTAALVHEELAAGDPGAAVALWAPHTAASAIRELGDAEQAKRFLARFNDSSSRLGAVAYSERASSPSGPAAGFSTVAERRAGPDGGWSLSGRKSYVVNGGRADLTVVFAQIDPTRGWDGAAAFVVPAGTPGLSAGEPHALLGLETVPAAEVVLHDCLVPDDHRLQGGGDLTAALLRFLARAALTTAARQVGLARAAWEQALSYTQDRHAFGKPVAHFQSIAFTLADMHMDVESARWMVWRAAAALDAGKKDALSTVAEAAVHANEAAFRVADNAVQLHGGAGYIQDFPVEKWLRDTKALALLGPADQLLSLTVAAAELGHPALGESWPHASVQPMFT